MRDQLRDLLARTLHEAEDGPTCDCLEAERLMYGDQADAILALGRIEERWSVDFGGIAWPATSEVEARRWAEPREGAAPQRHAVLWIPIPVEEAGSG